MNRRHAGLRAFTLVELLVVIGIIALLLAVLLPALNKARQQANLVTCQTHLRQIGQAIAIYVEDCNGVLPYGYWDGTTTTSYNAAKAGDWSTVVSNELSARLGNSYGIQGTTGGAQSFNRGIFLDVDTVAGDAPLHYSCHPRLMPNLASPLPFDGTATHGIVPYKIGSIQHSADIVLIMDGAQIADSPDASSGKDDPDYWGASATAYALDGWRLGGGWIYTPDWLLSGRAASDDGFPINPGFNKDAASISFVKPGVTTNGDIRWRHMNNTAANFLFVDGHVESHTISPNPAGGTIQPYKTDLQGRNFNVNP